MGSSPIFKRKGLWGSSLPRVFRKQTDQVITSATVDAALEHWKRVEGSHANVSRVGLSSTMPNDQVESPYRSENFPQAALNTSLLVALAVTFALGNTWMSQSVAPSELTRFAYKFFFLALVASHLFHTVQLFTRDRHAWLDGNLRRSLLRIAPLACFFLAAAMLLLLMLIVEPV